MSVMRTSRRRLAEEHGFTMLLAIGVMFVALLLTAAAFVAIEGDAHLSARDLDAKRAYYSARSAMDTYTYQLNQNVNYWSTCTNDTASGSVPGTTTGQTYTRAPVPANGNTACSTSNPVNTMIDTPTGTLRMAFTGTSGGTQPVTRGIVASYRKTTPLNYLWFTQYEAFDSTISGYSFCAVYYRAGRDPSCNINWTSGDVVNGPMYTMDQFLISGTPTFGRNSSDKIQSLASGSICAAGCGSANILGTAQPGISGVSEPSDNSGLLTDATNNGVTYSGTTTIDLGVPSTGQATIINCPGTSSVLPRCGAASVISLTAKPIIYVSNASGCTPPAYTPYGATYPATTSGGYSAYYGCAGDVYVNGNYNQPFTIAAANNIIVNGSIEDNGSTSAPSGSAVVGLVANQFIRVMHGVTTRNSASYGDCGSATDIGSQTLNSPTIDAALLALQHSFIVDNFDCGSYSNLGTLNVYGAIAQKFRGAVGTGGTSPSTGYLKNYNYDDRLAVLLPPYLFDISTSGWGVSRETLCVPGNTTGQGCTG